MSKSTAMHRRTVIQSMGMIASHTLFPSILTGFVASCSQKNSESTTYQPTFFSEPEFEILKEMIDLIIPETKTKSASNVGTHKFLDEVFTKCLTSEQKQIIDTGFKSFIKNFGGDNKLSILESLDKKAFSGDSDSAWFVPIKQYTLIGFFTSEEGTTKASNYVPVPGEYRGDIPLDDQTLNYGLTGLRYYI